jgi:hypothetical protein
MTLPCCLLFVLLKITSATASRWRWKLKVAAAQKQPGVEGILLEALAEAGIVAMPCDDASKRILLFDTREIPEPTGEERRCHYGVHPDMFCGYLRAGHFEKHLQYLVEYLRACFTNEEELRVMTLVCYDERGRWAAMALGKALAEIALRSAGFTLQRVSISSGWNDWDCGLCDRCKFWSRSWVEMNKATADVFARWQVLIGK